jgi:alpha-beta hydrolase superfamily lysophospholipase
LVALFKALVAEGWEVFSFDLDGHGRGSTSRWEDDTVREAVPDAVAHAAEGEPLPLHLLGHSLGAALVLRALTDGRLPDARSAVLLSAPLRIRPTLAAGAGELRGFFCADSWRQREHYGARGVVPAFGPFGRAAYPLRMAGGGGVAYVARVRRWVDSLELERAAPGVRVPTLLVAGSADRVVPPVQAERLAVRIPDVTLQAVPGATHWTLPFAPCAVAAVTRWLDARFPREE